MKSAAIEIVPCPAALARDALALVLRGIALEQRSMIAPQLGGPLQSQSALVDGLWIARQGEHVGGAAWGQPQPGNTAIFWPPQLAAGTDPCIAAELSQAVVGSLDAAGVGMTQVVLPDRQTNATPTIESVGFQYLVDLLYLTSETSAAGQRNRVPTRSEPADPLQFVPYAESQRKRLCDLVEQTYEGTRDCPAMNGRRTIDEVVDGYRATGVFQPQHWQIVRAGQQDVGVLLLAEHRAASHFELVYMGLVPAARGRGWGLHVTRQAQQIAANAGAERLVLAVDAANLPALAMYRDAGFVAWDRRAVFVRFGADSTAT